MEELLKQIIKDIKTLECNLVTEITSSRVETEMILRQIATYLSVSTQNLAEVHDIVLKFNTTISDIRAEFSKLNNIENELLKLPAETIKSRDYVDQKITAHSNKINNNLEKLSIYFKKLSAYVVKIGVKIDGMETSYKSLADGFKADLGKDQDNLKEIVNKLIDDKSAANVNSTEIAKVKIQQDTAKLKIKMALWIKIIGAVIGSGGVLYVLIDLITKYLTGPK